METEYWVKVVASATLQDMEVLRRLAASASGVIGSAEYITQAERASRFVSRTVQSINNIRKPPPYMRDHGNQTSCYWQLQQLLRVGWLFSLSNRDEEGLRPRNAGKALSERLYT
eukprot:scaffold179852_cov32-Tisochrysis_lutea.AAC.1